MPLVGKVPEVSKKFGSRAFRFMLSWMPETWRPPMPVWGAVLKVRVAWVVRAHPAIWCSFQAGLPALTAAMQTRAGHYSTQRRGQ